MDSQAACVVCGDAVNDPFTRVTIADSPVCHGCLTHRFQLAIDDEQHYPVLWGDILLDINDPAFAFIPETVRQQFLEKKRQYDVPPAERVFCRALMRRSEPYGVLTRGVSACGAFVGSGVPDGDLALNSNTAIGVAAGDDVALGDEHIAYQHMSERVVCQTCGFTICMSCGEPTPVQVIPHACKRAELALADAAAFEGLIRGKDYQICPNKRCARKLQLVDGCNHLHCMCNQQLCFVCGEPTTTGSNHWARVGHDDGSKCPRYNQQTVPGRRLFDRRVRSTLPASNARIDARETLNAPLPINPHMELSTREATDARYEETLQEVRALRATIRADSQRQTDANPPNVYNPSRSAPERLDVLQRLQAARHEHGGLLLTAEEQAEAAEQDAEIEYLQLRIARLRRVEVDMSQALGRPVRHAGLFTPSSHANRQPRPQSQRPDQSNAMPSILLPTTEQNLMDYYSAEPQMGREPGRRTTGGRGVADSDASGFEQTGNPVSAFARLRGLDFSHYRDDERHHRRLRSHLIPWPQPRQPHRSGGLRSEDEVQGEVHGGERNGDDDDDDEWPPPFGRY